MAAVVAVVVELAGVAGAPTAADMEVLPEFVGSDLIEIAQVVVATLKSLVLVKSCTESQMACIDFETID